MWEVINWVGFFVNKSFIVHFHWCHGIFKEKDSTCIFEVALNAPFVPLFFIHWLVLSLLMSRTSKWPYHRPSLGSILINNAIAICWTHLNWALNNFDNASFKIRPFWDVWQTYFFIEMACCAFKNLQGALIFSTQISLPVNFKMLKLWNYYWSLWIWQRCYFGINFN